MAQWKGTCELSVKTQVQIPQTRMKIGVLAQVCNADSPLVN